MTIGFEVGFAARPDMMQHENRADAREDRAQQIMRSAEVERVQSGTDNGVAKLLHREAVGRLRGHSDIYRKTAEETVSPRKSVRPTISGLTARQGFVFSSVSRCR